MQTVQKDTMEQEQMEQGTTTVRATTRLIEAKTVKKQEVWRAIHSRNETTSIKTKRKKQKI